MKSKEYKAIHFIVILQTRHNVSVTIETCHNITTEFNNLLCTILVTAGWALLFNKTMHSKLVIPTHYLSVTPPPPTLTLGKDPCCLHRRHCTKAAHGFSHCFPHRALAHLAFALALISFDVCRYPSSLGVSSTIENNGNQMHCKRKG